MLLKEILFSIKNVNIISLALLLLNNKLFLTLLFCEFNNKLSGVKGITSASI
jgi:hypothetical protein